MNRDFRRICLCVKLLIGNIQFKHINKNPLIITSNNQTINKDKTAAIAVDVKMIEIFNLLTVSWRNCAS